MKKMFILVVFISLSLKSSFGQNEQSVNNLITFAKLYGYIKYFHPSDEAAGIDWDMFAVYGCKQVESCKDQEDLKKTLNKIFTPIAPAIKIFDETENYKFNVYNITPENKSDYKNIAWQHLGIGIDDKNPIYKSTRTNRPIITKVKRSNFGTLTESLDINEYQDKEFIFSAYVKTIEGSGTGHLWVRIDKKDKSMGFFENMDRRPIKNSDWTLYEIKGKIDKGASKLMFGCFLSNSGKLVTGDWNLKISKELGWKTIYSKGFEDQKTGQDPAGIIHGALKDQAGHPEYIFKVSEKETINGKPGIEISSNPEFDEIKKTSPVILFPEFPKVGEYVKKEIGNGLSCIIPLSLYGNDEHTFPTSDKNKLEELKNNLKEISKDKNKSDNIYIHLGDLVITWNIFKHFYPYFDIAKTNWNYDLEESIKMTYKDPDDYGFLKTLRYLTAKLKDGHVNISLQSNTRESYACPIEWEWAENRLVITNSYNDTIPVKRGDIVISINGNNPESYFNETRKYISAATVGWMSYRANTLTLIGEKNSTIKLTIADNNGTEKDVLLARDVPLMKYYASFKKNEPVKKLQNDVYYIHIGMATMAEINKIMPDLVKCKSIICDLRGYPRDNTGLISHLLSSKDTSKNWMRIPQIIYPDQENIPGYRCSGWEMKLLEPHLNAKIIFIIDGRAISQAESYMSFIENYKLATIIGKPTAGTNGNVNPFTLPGGYSISWTGMKVVKHDGLQHHGVGILPNIYLEKTIKGIRENRDEFLEKAIELANTK